MATLLELSHELLHCILIKVEPRDTAAVAATCRYLNHYIRGNNLLHKELYNQHWDVLSGADVKWEQELRDAVRLGTILRSSSREVKEKHATFVAQRIEALVRTADPKADDSYNIRLLTEYFQDSGNVEAFLAGSSLFDAASTRSQDFTPNEELRQLSAKLHCLYGVPIDELPNTSVSTSPSACTRQQTRPHLIHTFARSKVYDLRYYTDETLWGPFMPDGSQNVDWEKVEAIMVVLGHNLKTFSRRTHGHFPLLWKDPFVGVTPNSYIAPPRHVDGEEEDEDDDDDDDDEYEFDTSPEGESMQIAELAPSLDMQDPYGVTGTWMRVVCFLDYNDLYHFNFHDCPPISEPRPPIDMEEGMLDIQENWRVTSIEPAGTNEEDPEEIGMDWSQFKGERLPVVHFSGTSRSLHASWDPDANSKIRVRGSVRQTPEGEVRWTTFSIFHGEERWRSESIQVGGLRSARGVIGNWFDKDKSAGGPAGPTAFWKQNDDFAVETARRRHWPRN